MHISDHILKNYSNLAIEIALSTNDIETIEYMHKNNLINPSHISICLKNMAVNCKQPKVFKYLFPFRNKSNDKELFSELLFSALYNGNSETAVKDILTFSIENGLDISSIDANISNTDTKNALMRIIDNYDLSQDIVNKIHQLLFELT